MRIRRNASRLLGLSYLAARPEAPPATSNELRPPPLMPAGTVYGYTAVNPRVPSVNNMEGACVLNMSPWDLPNKHDDDDCSPKEHGVRGTPAASHRSDSDMDDGTMRQSRCSWQRRERIVGGTEVGDDLVVGGSNGGEGTPVCRSSGGGPLALNNDVQKRRRPACGQWPLRVGFFWVGFGFLAQIIFEYGPLNCQYAKMAIFTYRQEDPFEEYFVHVPRRPGFAFSSFEYFNMEMKEEDDEIKNQEPANDMKDGRENTLIIKENEPMLLEEDDKMNKTQACTVKADILTCKKNDDKRWRRSSIGDYHLRNSRSYYTPSKKARFASNILEAADKMDYMDNNMSSTSSSSYDEKSDEDYIIGGARKTHAKTRKGKKVVQKIQAKKRIKKRSLKSIL
uniref:Uncharacterized protein n=1 Tax=Leersia perrieri TaxID=77586 RepID=A0A0D9VG20_9ORYZ